MKHIITKLFIIIGLLASYGGVVEAAELKAEGCEIGLGQTFCVYDWEYKTTPETSFSIKTVNKDSMWSGEQYGIPVTVEKIFTYPATSTNTYWSECYRDGTTELRYSEGRCASPHTVVTGNDTGTFNSTRSSQNESSRILVENYETKLPNQSNGQGVISFGTTELTVMEGVTSNTVRYGSNGNMFIDVRGGEVKATAQVTARCASGLVWTKFMSSTASSDSVAHQASAYKCVSPIVSSSGSSLSPEATISVTSDRGGSIQTVSSKFPSNSPGFANVEGYCQTGEKWGFLREYTASGKTHKSYDCIPNIVPISASQVTVAIDTNHTKNPEAGCRVSVAETTANSSLGSGCIADLVFNLNPHKNTALAVYEVSGSDSVGKLLYNIAPISWVDSRFTYVNHKYSYRPTVTLSYTKPLTFEIRQLDDTKNSFYAKAQPGTKVLARVTATPKIDKTTKCPGFINLDCHTYTWTYSSEPVADTGTNPTPATPTPTTTAPVAVTPVNPNAGNLPAGCASALPNSAYALANCPDGVGTPVTTTPVQSNNYLSSTLKVGNQSTEVETLQRFLVSQNYLASELVTGYYGPATEEAVKKFQCAKKIVCEGTPDTTGYGAVGPSTRAAINASSSTGATAQSDSSDINVLIQSLLAQVQALMAQLEALKARGM